MDRKHATTRSLRPELGRLWIRRAFRHWPGPQRRWVDVAAGRMKQGRERGSIPEAGAVETEGGLLYVPPVAPEQAGARDALVGALRGRAVPLLVHLGLDESLSASAGVPQAVVVDLLEALLAKRLDALDAVPRRAIVVWPLVAGLTDDEALWDEGCRRLRANGAACVQALVLELDPAERRELAGDGNEAEVYSRLFHGRAASERRFAATAARHGLDVFYRMEHGDSDRRARNAAAAELLALAGELWLRLGRGVMQGQDLLRASRWVEDTAVDVRALAAEGNLEIVEALHPIVVAEVLDEWARGGSAPTVEALLAEYVTPALP